MLCYQLQSHIPIGRCRFLVYGVISLLVSLCFADLSYSASDTDSQVVTDQTITLAIMERLQRDPGVDAGDVQIRTLSGVVTLYGNVGHLLAKQRAIRIAQSIRGVRVIHDQLKVVPVVRSDDAIIRDIKIALLLNPAAEVNDVTLEAQKGIVTLKGSVQSWVEKMFATRAAMQVRGVKAVHNQLLVKHPKRRNDDEMQLEIKAKMRWNIWIDDSQIKVDVKDGKVKLIGTVRSALEKERVRVGAWITGVTDVDVSELKVQWKERSIKRKSRAAVVTDAAIRSYLKQALQQKMGVRAAKVHVHVNAGIVTLAGTVQRLATSYMVYQLARNTLGVWRVKNLLQVKPQINKSDEQIRKDVLQRLAMDPYIHDKKLSVVVMRGRVHLYGTIASLFLRQRLTRLVAQIPGVRGVQSHLALARTNLRRKDWELQMDVRSELFWTFLSPTPNIQIRVYRGVVTLTGTVQNWRDYRQAEISAYNAGAVEVENQLKVVEGPKFLKPSSTAEIQKRGKPTKPRAP